MATNTGYEWPAAAIFATKSTGGDYDGATVADGAELATTLIDLTKKASIEITVELTMASGTVNAPLTIAFLREIAGAAQPSKDAFAITKTVAGDGVYKWAFVLQASDWSKVAPAVVNETNVATTGSVDIKYKTSDVPVAS